MVLSSDGNDKWLRWKVVHSRDEKEDGDNNDQDDDDKKKKNYKKKTCNIVAFI